MAKETRIVTRTGKDPDGDITSLCRPGTWSPRTKAAAINDINSGQIEYRVKSNSGPVVAVVSASYGTYLRSEPDNTTTDNLDTLPDC